MGVGFHSRGDPQKHSRASAGVGVKGVEPVELVEGVHHDAAHPGFDRGREFVSRLVVAVHHQPIPGHARGLGHMQLSAGGHVQVETLLVNQTGHGQAQECLGGVGHRPIERGSSLVAPIPHVGFVVDKQRGAEFPGQVKHIATSDGQPPLGSH